MTLSVEKKSEFLLLMTGVTNSVTHARGEQVVLALKAKKAGRDEEAKQHKTLAAKLRKLLLALDAEYEELREGFYDAWLVNANNAAQHFTDTEAILKDIHADLQKTADRAKNIGKAIEKGVKAIAFLAAFL